MTSAWFLTPDRVGIETGGGLVTLQEHRALKDFAGESVPVISLDHTREYASPFAQDEYMRDRVVDGIDSNWDGPRLAHCYSGCLSKTVAVLKGSGSVVTYTVAAHDKDISKNEHEKWGFPFPYPHLTDPESWRQYIKGYQDSDVVICPSKRAADVVRKYPHHGRIEVIPHGCTLPKVVKPLPKTFTVGYLGSCVAPDKGVIYLIQAWKKLNYKDAVLVLAGRDSTSPYVREMVAQYGGGAVILKGWVEDVSDFYNGISILVQPSVTEGFGLEVLEAMAHGRVALCSVGVGAADVALEVFKAGDPDELARWVDGARGRGHYGLTNSGKVARGAAEDYTWGKIRGRYRKLWEGLL